MHMIDRVGAKDRLNNYPQAYLGLAELAEVIGISKGTLEGRLRRNKVPEPMVRLSMGPVWDKVSVSDWLSNPRLNQLVSPKKEKW